jgi:hypothetical protein
MRPLALALLLAIAIAACDLAPAPAAPAVPVEPVPALSALDLQVRNSGMPGGYLWLGIADQPNAGRWHPFGMAEFLCVTCPRPFLGAGAGYEIAVFDESCQQLASFQSSGGSLQVAIDLGPAIELVPAPPLGDWMPGDSPPADAGTVPCSPP